MCFIYKENGCCIYFIFYYILSIMEINLYWLFFVYIIIILLYLRCYYQAIIHLYHYDFLKENNFEII